jgi:hypothetical protein
MRTFRYYANPEEIADYLRKDGYDIVDKYDRYGKELLGFTVAGTTVDLSYDLVVRGKVVGQGLIRLLRSNLEPDPNNPGNKTVNDDFEQYKRSLRLYQKLHRRFGKPRSN